MCTGKLMVFPLLQPVVVLYCLPSDSLVTTTGPVQPVVKVWSKNSIFEAGLLAGCRSLFTPSLEPVAE